MPASQNNGAVYAYAGFVLLGTTIRSQIHKIISLLLCFFGPLSELNFFRVIAEGISAQSAAIVLFAFAYYSYNVNSVE